MLEQKFRLKKRTEFAYSYLHGSTFFGTYINLVVFKRKDKLLRIGFSVSKKIGKAVVRNKTKRRLRAIVQSFVGQISRGYNLIVVAKPGIENQNFETLKQSVLKMFETKNLINNCKSQS